MQEEGDNDVCRQVRRHESDDQSHDDGAQDADGLASGEHVKEDDHGRRTKPGQQADVATLRRIQ